MCPGSDYYVHYGEEEQNVLARPLGKESFVLPTFFVFVENGCVEHAGTGYLGHPNLRHHVYFVTKGIKLPDTIELSYGGSFAIQKKLDSIHKTFDLSFPENFGFIEPYNTCSSVRVMSCYNIMI